MFAAKLFEPTLLVGLAAAAALLACGTLLLGPRVPAATRRGLAVLLGVAALVLVGAAREVGSRGFHALYFADYGLSGAPVHDALEPDFQMEVVRARVLDVSQRRFSVRWVGWAAPVDPGPHTLRVWHYGRVDVLVDGEIVLSSAPGKAGAERIFDGRMLREATLELGSGFHRWELRYEPGRDSDYALSVELEDERGLRSRLATSLVLPESPGAGLALGPGAVLAAAFATVAAAGVALVMLAAWLSRRITSNAHGTLAWLEASPPVRGLARPVVAAERTVTSAAASPSAAWIAPLLLALLASAVLFGRLGERPMWGDEVIHGTAAAHAAVDGNWYPLRFEGDAYLEKPPLKIWAEALVFRVFGVGAAQARSLDALAGLLTVLGLYFVAARSRLLRDDFDPSLGLFAGAMLAMAPTFIHDHGARGGVQDATLLFSTIVTFGLALEGLRACTRGLHRRGYLLMFIGGVTMSVGYGVKSLAGFLPGVVWVVFQLGAALLARSRGEPVRLRERLLQTLTFGAVPVASLILWTAFSVQTLGEDYLGAMHGTLVGRARGDLGSVQPPSFYVDHIVASVFAIGLWGRLVPIALGYGIWRWLKAPSPRDVPGARSSAGLAVTTTVVTVALYSLSRAKHPWYVLPAYPWMALLVAGCLLHGIRALLRRGAWPRLGTLAAAGVSVGVICAFLSSIPNAMPWLGELPRRSPDVLVEDAIAVAPGASFFVLEEHDIPAGDGVVPADGSLTHRRSLAWMRLLLRSRGTEAVVSRRFVPPPGEDPFFVLARSERSLPPAAPWLDEITGAAAFNEELTLLAGRVVADAFPPLPIVTDDRLPLDLSVCGNLRPYGAIFQVVVSPGEPCALAIVSGAERFPWWEKLMRDSPRDALDPSFGVQLRLLGRTAAPVRVELQFAPEHDPWTGFLEAWVGGQRVDYAPVDGHSVGISLAADTLDGVDLALRLIPSAPGASRLQRLRVLPEKP